MTVIGQNYDHI